MHYEKQHIHDTSVSYFATDKCGRHFYADRFRLLFRISPVEATSRQAQRSLMPLKTTSGGNARESIDPIP